MNYESWRISFQSSEGAARQAFKLWKEALEQEERTQRTMYCGTADAFIAMDDDHKRRWFVQSLRESKRRKELEDILEQPAQEPVAWINVKDKLPPQEINFLSFSETFGYQVSMYSSNPLNSTGLPTLERLKITKWMPIPLYTHPCVLTHTAPEWQGLTSEEIESLDLDNDVISVIFQTEMLLKEKNT
jgi:hypothetical protein